MNAFAKMILLSGTMLAAGAAQAQTQTVPAPAPAAAQADPAPAQLAAAQRVVELIFPEGTYQRVFSKSFGPMMEQMTESMGNMPMGATLRAAGLQPDDAAKLDKATMSQVMEIYDPYWHERLKRVTAVISDSMVGMMVKVEPLVRTALSRAYAREFSVAELGDMERFFSTPAGKHYASQAMALFMDPEIMKAMTDFMPEMMKSMPDMMARAMEATRDLPPQRHNKDLTPAERKRLGELLGIDPAKLKDDGNT